LPARVSRLRLVGVIADALRLTVDGSSLGWAWPTVGELCFEKTLAAGTHRLHLELVPNTFNTFGPHHYFAGDRHVISPDQFTGKKNFADPADAPAGTLVKTWHFRPFQLPQSISILG
jgi:hypothetical protein